MVTLTRDHVLVDLQGASPLPAGQKPVGSPPRRGDSAATRPLAAWLRIDARLLERDLADHPVVAVRDVERAVQPRDLVEVAELRGAAVAVRVAAHAGARDG